MMFTLTYPAYDPSLAATVVGVMMGSRGAGSGVVVGTGVDVVGAAVVVGAGVVDEVVSLMEQSAPSHPAMHAQVPPPLHRPCPLHVVVQMQDCEQSDEYVSSSHKLHFAPQKPSPQTIGLGIVEFEQSEPAQPS